MDNRFSFRKGYEQLAQKDVKDFRNRLCERLGIKDGSIYRKMSGEVEPKMSEGRIIEEVFAEFGVTDVWGE